jgi:hypothetical protein
MMKKRIGGAGFSRRKAIQVFEDPMMMREKKMKDAVLQEQTLRPQRIGRDSAKTVPLLSELRFKNPGKYLIRRAMYRAEMALESVSNRVYALFAMVLLLLALSILFFWAVSVVGGDKESNHLKREARGIGGDDDDGDAVIDESEDGDGGDGDHGHAGGGKSDGHVLLYLTWLTWCFFVDPGAHTELLDPQKYQWSRLSAALISIVGIIFFSFVLGFVVELLDSFMARVTQGRSSVIEEGHYLILGNSEKCVAVIAELATAMESDGGGVVVVLADYPSKMEFDLLVANHLQTVPALTNGGKTRVVFRPGSPLITANLLKVSPETSRAVIVLSDTRQDADHADANVLHIILSLKSILGPRTTNNQSSSSSLQEYKKRASLDNLQSLGSIVEGGGDNGRGFNQKHGFDYGDNNTDSPPSSCSSSLDTNHEHFYPVSPPQKSHEANEGIGGVPPSMFQGQRGNPPLITRRISMHSTAEDAEAAELAFAREQEEKMRKQYKGHVIAEVMNMDNKPIIQISGGSIVELVVVHDIIGRMLAKSTMQPNIRRIYDDLLGFDGCEFYFASHDKEFDGVSFREASLRLKGAVLVGVKRGPTIMLNPESKLPQNVAARKADHLYTTNGAFKAGSQFLLQKGDEIIVIAEDDSSYEILDLPIFDGGSSGSRPWPPRLPLLSAQDAFDIDLNAKEDAAAEALALKQALQAKERARITLAQEKEVAAEAKKKGKAEAEALKAEAAKANDGAPKAEEKSGSVSVPVEAEVEAPGSEFVTTKRGGGRGGWGGGGSSRYSPRRCLLPPSFHQPPPRLFFPPSPIPLKAISLHPI